MQSNSCGLQQEKANPSKDLSTLLQTDVHYISEKFIILHNFWVVLTKGNSFQVTWVNSLLKIYLLVFSFVLLPKSIMNNKRKKSTIHLGLSLLIESLLCEYSSSDYHPELVSRLTGVSYIF